MFMYETSAEWDCLYLQLSWFPVVLIPVIHFKALTYRQTCPNYRCFRISLPGLTWKTHYFPLHFCGLGPNWNPICFEYLPDSGTLWILTAWLCPKDCSVPISSLIDVIDAWIAVSVLQCSNFITYWCLDCSVPISSLIDAWIAVFQFHHLLM